MAAAVKKNCKFYNLPQGCRNGENCRFEHANKTCRFDKSPNGCRFGETCRFVHEKPTTAVSKRDDAMVKEEHKKDVLKELPVQNVSNNANKPAAEKARMKKKTKKQPAKRVVTSRREDDDDDVTASMEHYRWLTNMKWKRELLVETALHKKYVKKKSQGDDSDSSVESDEEGNIIVPRSSRWLLTKLQEEGKAWDYNEEEFGKIGYTDSEVEELEKLGLDISDPDAPAALEKIYYW